MIGKSITERRNNCKQATFNLHSQVSILIDVWLILRHLLTMLVQKPLDYFGPLHLGQNQCIVCNDFNSLKRFFNYLGHY